MSEAGLVSIIVACIMGIPGIVAAILANIGRQHAKAARVQVENDHSTNLRDDLDKSKVSADDANDKLSLGLRLLLSAKSDIRGLRRDIGRIYNRLDHHEELLDDIQGRGEKDDKRRERRDAAAAQRED